MSANPKQKKVWVLSAIGGVVVVALAVMFVARPSLAFGFSLDGKPLPLGAIPQVELDGHPFTSGLSASPGSHTLTVTLAAAEPVRQKVWLLMGTKELGEIPLILSKGSVRITVEPAPATVTVRRGLETVGNGPAPLTLGALLPGAYDAEIKHGEYSEIHHMKVLGDKQTDEMVTLDLGSISLSSEPPDAEYQISGNGLARKGSLPAKLDDLPSGDYQISARRKGWRVSARVSVSRGNTATKQIEFPYGTIEVTSVPTGLTVSMDGADVGKTPMTLTEIRPSTYALSVTDGINTMKAEVAVGAHGAEKHPFLFRYGSVELSSAPSGATVFRSGKQLGQTPLVLDRVPAGDAEIELRLDGYASARPTVHVKEGESTAFTAKLFSDGYVRAMASGKQAMIAGDFVKARDSVAMALATEPNDAAALTLGKDIGAAAEQAEKAAAEEKARRHAQELASIRWFSLDQMLTDCTDRNTVQYPVQVDLGYYQTVTDANGKKRQVFQKTGEQTEMRTRVDSTFNGATFAQRYQGNVFGFNCPEGWTVARVQKDGSLILKAGGMGSAEMHVYPPADKAGAFHGVQKGQKINVRGAIMRFELPGLFRPGVVYMDRAELLADAVQ